MSGRARRLLAVWRSLSPKDRKTLARAWNLLVTLVVGILVQKILARLLVSQSGRIATTATAASLATLGGTTIANQGPPAFEPMAHANLSAEIAGTPVADDPVARAAAIVASQTAAQDTTAGPDQVDDPRTLAAQFQRGCTTKQVRNYSSRNGARPALLVPHYTVSANRAGWSDIDAIVSYFNTSRAQASSNYVIDFEGNCAYIVGEAAKAWTQGFFNPWSISIEFIATGREKVWPDPVLRKGALVFADAARRWGIPIQPAVVQGCRIVRAGIIDHDALDCGNDHTDVKPFFPMAKFIGYVRQAAGPIPKPKPLARPYRVCSWKPGKKTMCANAVRAGEAVEVRLRRGHTRVSVRRR